MRKWTVIALAALALMVPLLVVGGVALLMGVMGMMDRSNAHVCAIAAVRRSPAAVALVGTPIEQTGFTGGSMSDENGALQERATFDVKGPRGRASVLAQGTRSPFASHLRVRIGRDGSSTTIYNGTFDCAELHVSKKR